MKLRRLVAVLLVGGSIAPAAMGQAAALCTRIDPGTRLDNVARPPFPLPAGHYSYPEGALAAFPSILASLRAPDPEQRIDALAKLGSRSWVGEWEAVDRRIAALLQGETHVQVIEQVFLSACKRSNPSLGAFLAEAAACALDEPLSAAARRCAVAEPRLLGPAVDAGSCSSEVLRGGTRRVPRRPRKDAFGNSGTCRRGRLTNATRTGRTLTWATEGLRQPPALGLRLGTRVEKPAPCPLFPGKASIVVAPLADLWRWCIVLTGLVPILPYRNGGWTAEC